MNAIDESETLQKIGRYDLEVDDRDAQYGPKGHIEFRDGDDVLEIAEKGLGWRVRLGEVDRDAVTGGGHAVWFDEEIASEQSLESAIDAARREGSE